MRRPISDSDEAKTTHLGDGAYVKTGAYRGEVVIFTHNGVAPTNSVFLEPLAVKALLEWLKENSQ